MDNRFLFRGKMTDADKWVTGTHYVIPAPPQCMGKPEPDTHRIVFENPHTISDWGMPRQMVQADVIAETVGQCTGFFASKSYRGSPTLIYEGDCGIHHAAEIDVWCKVVWLEHEGAWGLMDIEGNYTSLAACAGEFEITGTIYDQKGGE